MSILHLLVGPPGSGKSTYAKTLGGVYVNQDSQTKEGHLEIFNRALSNQSDIIVDRMNFSIEQRKRYIEPAKALGYYTIRVTLFHVAEKTCRDRCAQRLDHPTVKTELDASKAINFFFSKYEQPTHDEGIDRIYIRSEDNIIPDHAIIVDLDGTLANIDHRLHFVKREGKKDWKGFFDGIPGDSLNNWCAHLIHTYRNQVILVSGRPDSHRKETEKWLLDNGIRYDVLHMRRRNDFRRDDVVKEIIFDFNIAPYFNVLFCVDDRSSIVKLWRSKGLVCLACADGDF